MNQSGNLKSSVLFFFNCARRKHHARQFKPKNSPWRNTDSTRPTWDIDAYRTLPCYFALMHPPLTYRSCYRNPFSDRAHPLTYRTFAWAISNLCLNSRSNCSSSVSHARFFTKTTAFSSGSPRSSDERGEIKDQISKTTNQKYTSRI